MQRMNGDVATEALRTYERATGVARTHVIGLTAYANDRTRAHCLAKGMDEYVTKPMQRATLEHTMAALVSRPKAEPQPQPPRSEDAASSTSTTTTTTTTTSTNATTGGVPADLAAVDPTVINLSELWSDGGFGRDVIDKLLDNALQVSADSIAEPARAEEWAAVAAETHRIAGLAALLRARPLRAALRALEEAARDEPCDCAAIHSLVSVALAELARFHEALQPLAAAR